jgi:hypothetical protein
MHKAVEEYVERGIERVIEGINLIKIQYIYV